MIHWIRLSCVLCIIGLCAFLALPGCNSGKPAGKKDDPDPKKDAHLDYGPHGGPCAEWGEEDFHAEFIVDAAKNQVTIYLLDGNAEAAPKIDAAKVHVELTIISTKPLVKVELKYSKEASSDKGIAFIGANDLFAKPDGMKVNVSGTVSGKPYSGDVEYKSPKKTAQLYLSPGGIYTIADIKANGNTTPAEKFKGKSWAHSDDLKPGDKICPITKNKAEAECGWIVNAQRYEFCCPPCLEKFMGWAHNQPDKIKNANEYVFKGS